LYCASLNRRTFAAITAMSMVVPVLWAQPRLEKSKITIAVGGKAALCYLPLTIAEQLGYFRAEGLDVEISDLADGSRAMQAVHGGHADVVSGSFENTISLQSKGHKFQAFVLQGRAPAISMGLSIRPPQPLRSVADLKGKTIGISAPGSATHRVAQLMLSRAGLKPGDVNFVGVGTSTGALTAWRSGQLDAMSNVDPVMTMLEQKGEIRLIADSRTLKGSVDLFGGAMPAACLYAPIEFIQKNPNTVQALTNAMVHGLKWLQTAGPSDLIKTVPEAYLLGDRALYLSAFDKVREAISPDGMIFEDGPHTALRVLTSIDSGIKADKIEMASTYTNDFARLAKSKFKV
jgi:NitT/TauT family transport system substrate-binding protein